MFEKYTEKALRAIFHAREETSKFGTPRIESEQLLLGLLAADKSIFGRYLGAERTHQRFARRSSKQLRLDRRRRPAWTFHSANESKRILMFSAEESTSLGRQRVDTEDLLLGILREKDSFGARLLGDRGLDLEQARGIAKGSKHEPQD
jgi:ATP-dependent Clp protease ATP-binding subunit ClpA